MPPTSGQQQAARKRILLIEPISRPNDFSRHAK
jgi:hypothetical protein